VALVFRCRAHQHSQWADLGACKGNGTRSYIGINSIHVGGKLACMWPQLGNAQSPATDSVNRGRSRDSQPASDAQ